MTGLNRVFDLIRPLRFRGKYRLINPLAPASGEHPALVFGCRMRLDVSEHIQRMIYLGCFERRETQMVMRVLRSGMTMVDVGANVGYFTTLAAHQVGRTGSVIAVEPSSAPFAHLRYLTTRNRIPQVRLFRGALSDRRGREPIYCGDPGNHTPTMIAHGDLAPLEYVSVRTLDDLVTELGIDRIDLLKIDVEGYEAAVIRGARDLLERRAIGSVLCEFNDYWLRASGTSSAALWRTFLDLGFRDYDGRRAAPSDIVENRLLVLGAR